MSSDDPVISEWIERFDLISLDIQDLLLRRKVFRRLQEIVEKNPKLHHPSYLYDYLGGTYAASAAIGVRRHVRQDDQKRDASLIGLLFDIRRHPELLTRGRHAALYQAVGMPANIAEKEFDRIAGPGLPALEKRHIQPDIDALTGPGAEALERYATQRIAHLDREQPKSIPKFDDLDVAFDAFERILKRYKLILRCEGGDVVPVIVEPWERVLREPWIQPEVG